MRLKRLLLICFQVSILATAQTLSRDILPRYTIPDILSSYSQLSRLSTLVESLPLLVQQFNSADNFTFLAPTNDAISSWLTTNRSMDYIQAALQYHLLNGTYPSASISSTPIFIPTALTNPSYCNVTGGQRVKASNNGHLAFSSALNTTSSTQGLITDLIALGGILHTIDRVLELPIGPVQSFIAQNLSYELALAAEGGFLSSESRPLVDAFFDKSDATYFISNSAKALADANLTAVNQTTLLQFIGYDAAPQVIYSTAFANGTQIMTDLGVPLFVTVQDGDTYINFAKVTSVDNFVSNGVFHVIDDILDPRNITGPSFPSTTSLTQQPTNTTKAQQTKQLSVGAKAGIGAGTVVGVILVVAGASALLCFKKRNSDSGVGRNTDTWIGRDQTKPGELSGNPLHEYPQLDSTESAAELPAGYGFHQAIGRPI